MAYGTHRAFQFLNKKLNDNFGESTTPQGGTPSSGSDPGKLMGTKAIDALKNKIPTITDKASAEYVAPAEGMSRGLEAARKVLQNKQKEKGTVKTVDPGVGAELPKN